MARRHRRTLAAVAAFAVVGALALVAPAAQAATPVTWLGTTSGDWATATNWDPGLPAAGQTAVFPAAGLNKTTNNNLGSNPALDSILFSGAGYIVGGNPVDVGANGIAQTVAGQNAISGIAPSTPSVNIPITIASGGTLTSGAVTGNPSLTKTGAGRLVLAGVNTYTGTTTVSGGALIVNNSSVSSPVTVNASSALGGGGTTGPVTMTGGAISPGDGGAGSLTVSGALSMTAAATLGIDIFGPTAGSTLDVLNVSGQVSLAGAQLVVAGSFVGTVGQQFLILNNTGASAISGTFANLPQGATVNGGTGQTYTISYTGGDGNDIVLTEGQGGGKTALVLSGVDRVDTAVKISQNAFPTGGSAAAVVLARGDVFPDALAGAPLAVAKGGPLLLANLVGPPPSAVDGRTVAEIQRVLTSGKTIFVLGGTSAIPDSQVQQLQGLGYQVLRQFAGTDRFQTAVLIAQNGLANPVNLFLANGMDFPDALSGGPAAVKTGGAILLTNFNLMPAFTSQYLATRTGATVWALGGPAAATGGAPVANQIIGVDRYDTAVRTAQRFFTNPTSVGVASGVSFPDGLTGGAHIGKQGGPLLLTDPNTLPGNVQAYLTSIKATLLHVFVYGGSAAVSTPVVTSINAAVA